MLSSFLLRPIRIKNERPGTVQTDSTLPDADGTALMKGMSKDMQVSVDESFSFCKLPNIGPDWTPDRILSSPVPGDVGQGDKEILPLSLIMEHLIQSERIKRLVTKQPSCIFNPALGDSCVAE